MTLASIPSPPESVWHLGPFPLRAYALCIIAGVIAAVLISERRLRARGGPAGAVIDVAVYAVPAGIIGARIYHIITTPEPYFGENGHLSDIFRIWNGGLGIWGAIAGGALGSWFACRRIGIPLRVFADAVAPGLVVAQAIGRWGNWFNQELFGRATDLPWALKIDTDHRPGETFDQATYHPTFLYESLWCLGVAAILIWADRRYRLGNGRVFALYGLLYVTGRAWIEYLRIDDAHEILGLRLNIWTSLIVGAFALWYLITQRGPREQLVPIEGGGYRAVPEGQTAEVVAATSADDSADAEDDSADTADEPDDADDPVDAPAKAPAKAPADKDA